MNTVVKIQPKDVGSIPYQEASYDIWDKKYRLIAKDGSPIDRSMDDTYKRVARALADVESPEVREQWYESFLWSLRHGAIPAGRVTSNAGALEHKPATSTINCTVSGTIRDSMDDILKKVHEAGLTLKAGCVAPGTLVRTERGLVTADRAVAEKHREILCYDREEHRFEMRPITKHMTTHVPQAENIRITSNGATLTTSVKHPVLVHRDGTFSYVRADEVQLTDSLVHHRFAWSADVARWRDAWFAGAHLGDGSAYPKKFSYKPTRSKWARRASELGQRLVFKIRAAEREVVERYAEFFASFSATRAVASATATKRGTPVWDFTVASFGASRAVELIDGQIGAKSATLRVPQWVAAEPERHFLPFLAGLIDTDGTVDSRGNAHIGMQSRQFATELQSLLGLFGVHASVTSIPPREHELDGIMVRGSGGAVVKICDSGFLGAVAGYMADSGKRNRIVEHATTSGQYDVFQMHPALRRSLEIAGDGLTHRERQHLGFYHGYPQRDRISRVWLDRWRERFPHLAPLIALTERLRPVDGVERGLPLPETFFDFTVEKHNNYVAGNAGLIVIHNCGIGYEFSTLRPRGAYVTGAGAYTSGPLSFMDIYDKMCFTVSSAGGRRGAQMGTFDIGHPDVLEFIRAKRENGRLRQFNLSLLVTDEFMKAVKSDKEWKLAFPLSQSEYESDRPDLDDKSKFVWREWPDTTGYVANEEGLVVCKVYKTMPARRVWDLIMSSTYDFAEPGFILIDRVNEMNNNWWTENIRATNPCGEQPLPPYGSCLLGSVNLTKFVVDPFTENARFDWETYRKVCKVFTRMLDNVVEINGLPLEQQRDEIMRKRRHGMGFLGLGSTITMLCMKYGSKKSIEFTEKVSREMAHRRLGSRTRARTREGTRADHERGVHGHARDAAQASRDGTRWLARGRQDRGPGAARALQPLHAARRRSRARARRRAGRGRCALHASHLDRADGHDLALAREQRLERHRAVLRAPLFPQRDPRGQEVEGEDRRVLVRAARVPRAGQSAGDARRRRPRPRSSPSISSRRTTSARRNTWTSRPRRRSGSTPRSRRRPTCRPTTSTRTSRKSTCMRSMRGSRAARRSASIRRLSRACW